MTELRLTLKGWHQVSSDYTFAPRTRTVVVSFDDDDVEAWIRTAGAYEVVGMEIIETPEVSDD